MKKKSIMIISLPVLFTFLILIIIGINTHLMNQKPESAIGQYEGISSDGKWNVNFDVYYNNNNLYNVTVKGELICNEQNFLQAFSEDDFLKMQVAVYKRNGISNGLASLKDINPNTFIIINPATTDKEIYKKMEISLGTYNTTIDIKKLK